MLTSVHSPLNPIKRTMLVSAPKFSGKNRVMLLTLENLVILVPYSTTSFVPSTSSNSCVGV